MSQITRCPACRTSFRVVADQLRISGGWVRCGRCKEVFDASANLLADVRYSPVPQPKEETAAAPSAAPVSQPPVAAPAAPSTPSVPTAASESAEPEQPVKAPEPESPSSSVAATPKVVVPPTPVASYSQNLPVPEERPNVWSNARASITGFSNASIQHLAQENVEDKSEPSPAAPTPTAPVRPWAGHYSPSPTVQRSGYGQRREANVVPPDWKPATEAPKPVTRNATSEADEKHIEPEFVASRLVEDASKSAPVESHESQHDEPIHRTEPTLDEDASTTVAPHQAIVSQEPELHSQGSMDDDDDDDEKDMPELTFEASRQHELVDEPVIVGVHEHDAPDASQSDPVIATQAEAIESTLDQPHEPVEAKAEVEEAPEAHGATDAEDKTHAKADEPEALIAEPQPQQEAAPSEDEVGFMRDARRKAFWSKPAVRALLVLVMLGLLAGFAGQYAVAERNRLAAMYPALRPALERLCQPLHCEVGLPRQIASVAIDSSTFTRVRDDATAFNLQVALKSTADMVLEMPALELTLTDSSDQPVLRRVLKREDTGAPAELAANGEWSGVIKLQVPEVADRVTGYRLLAFYP